MFDNWRRHVMTNRRCRLSVTAFVDHPVGTHSSVQNVQNNEGIVSSTQIVGPMITSPILGNFIYEHPKFINLKMIEKYIQHDQV